MDDKTGESTETAVPMFVDIIEITIKAGDGGDGCVSFHREKYVSRGGPDGGDGGRGGDIVFVADPAMRTLLDFRYQKRYEAESGAPGERNNRTGRSAPPLTIRVPVGTVIRRKDTGEVVADLSEPHETRVILEGGRGGKGNARFATPTRQKPDFAQPGQRTRSYTVVLELLTLADVGLVGFPNVGKSTLLAATTSARPRIADYHFTTLSPNLGIARIDESSFVIADIPGLIENAHQGAGLGHDFLRHIARTRLIVHVLDVSGIEGRDPVEDYDKIRRELSLYGGNLDRLPEIVACNKMDLPGASENLARVEKHVAGRAEVYGLSAVTGQGVTALLRAVAARLKTLPEPRSLPEETTLTSFIEDQFTVEELAPGRFRVSGTLIDRLLDGTNMQSAQSLQRFQRRLREKGVIDALREKGARQGDTVALGDMEFDFEE